MSEEHIVDREKITRPPTHPGRYLSATFCRNFAVVERT
jgi:hypothetical protein